ncbi:uncharacterized protein A4U43_C07F8830 [Asparagus officinalis]|uniref:Uncharacterized protein n=1 Tax=Asparagus officinalis TaxID=4686 RepID=A0A5P1EAK5_ASPOF|nr:uncharacterized protein A4U43_C07F8830 [Asparagus officinalis]
MIADLFSLLSSLFSLYTGILNSLSRTNNNSNLNGEIDRFLKGGLGELRGMGGVKGEDLRGPMRLLKALVGEGREREGVEEVGGRGGAKVVGRDYEEWDVHGKGRLRRGGGDRGCRGLRMLGDEEGTKMVERDYEEWDVHGQWGRLRRGERR